MTSVPDAIIALTFYALWAMFLVLSIGASRVRQVATGKTKVTGFTAGVPHGSDAYWRLNRAHMNTIENLPIFATVVLTGLAAGLAANATFNMLAVIVVCARAAQSLIHVASGSAGAINLRFSAYVVQIVCQMWMALLILKAAGVF